MVDLKENYLQIPRGGRVRNDTDAGLLIPKRKRNKKATKLTIRNMYCSLVLKSFISLILGKQ